ncbi:MAG: helix-turn-helix domain-containing protein [Candidatus Eremiobacteraeota bacterium]|nr:helix-turn-helix domain-containing protein [Candidatus Eremiobacteraeota bacterium]
MSKMLSVTEAAEHFKVSTATIRRWIRSGRVRSQLTLGPFGEQWMIEPDGLTVEDRAHGPYVPVEQLMEKPDLVPTIRPKQADQPPDQGVDQGLLREAQEALEEAWQAKEKAEQELEELRKHADLTALRQDLEGSERQRARLQLEVTQLRQSEQQAWEETRTALRALGGAYSESERLTRRLHGLETESDCFRRSLAQRLGLDWRDYSVLELFLRWDSMGDFMPSSERADWSQMRRRHVTEEMEVG